MNPGFLQGLVGDEVQGGGHVRVLPIMMDALHSVNMDWIAAGDGNVSGWGCPHTSPQATCKRTQSKHVDTFRKQHALSQKPHPISTQATERNQQHRQYIQKAAGTAALYTPNDRTMAAIQKASAAYKPTKHTHTRHCNTYPRSHTRTPASACLTHVSL